MTTSASVKRYNLTPWASKVVELIQKNWDIPPTRPANPDAAVEIVIVLQKGGQVSNMEVIPAYEKLLGEDDDFMRSLEKMTGASEESP